MELLADICVNSPVFIVNYEKPAVLPVNSVVNRKKAGKDIRISYLSLHHSS